MANSSTATRSMVSLFRKGLEIAPNVIESINDYGDRVSIRSTSGSQIDYLDLNKERAEEKLAQLRADLEKLCIRDANYWVTLPTGSWVRKNAIQGIEFLLGERYKGLVLRTYGNRILSFIPCDDLDTQLMIKQEIQKATAASSPSRRYKPTWNFYQNAV
ncbi:hypothetical protein BOO22_13845 [Vibrio cidicii]|uniref:hypothetical protein n=1 Tax=Vibrio cidicii TaxID=1763883 RepID=UPI0018C3413E|nr:hypothetical protein [Vibrio cidicii]MBG0760501.1 hypothetical protein [Vibrio cidicii]